MSLRLVAVIMLTFAIGRRVRPPPSLVEQSLVPCCSSIRFDLPDSTALFFDPRWLTSVPFHTGEIMSRGEQPSDCGISREVYLKKKNYMQFNLLQFVNFEFLKSTILKIRFFMDVTTWLWVFLDVWKKFCTFNIRVRLSKVLGLLEYED
jgi:hypothetical protein